MLKLLSLKLFHSSRSRYVLVLLSPTDRGDDLLFVSFVLNGTDSLFVVYFYGEEKQGERPPRRGSPVKGSRCLAETAPRHHAGRALILQLGDEVERIHAPPILDRHPVRVCLRGGAAGSNQQAADQGEKKKGSVAAG